MQEVQVFDYNNVNKALNKNAIQPSTTIWNGYSFPAGRAVNGITNGDNYDFSMTGYETGKFNDVMSAISISYFMNSLNAHFPSCFPIPVQVPGGR